MQLPDIGFWKDKRVFITGAEGFKGKWLVRWLSRMEAIIGSNGDVDICNKSRLKEQLEEFMPEIVIHMAAVSTIQEAVENPIETIRTNAVGTITLLEILREIKGVKVILNVVTDKVYHISGMDHGYVESDPLGGLEPYSVSKVCSEVISTMYQKTYRLPLATARAGNVIGGNDWKETRIVPTYFRAWKEGKILDVNVGAIRPWQYVLDALCGYLLLCEKLYDNTSYVGAWNFASNEFESRSVQWLVDEMNLYFSPKVKYRLIDDRGYYETKILKLNSEKARKVLGWEPKYSMAEMIRYTCAWYKEFEHGVDIMDRQIEEYVEGKDGTTA